MTHKAWGRQLQLGYFSCDLDEEESDDIGTIARSHLLWESLSFFQQTEALLFADVFASWPCLSV